MTSPKIDTPVLACPSLMRHPCNISAS
uniref:Uncharacterized protein n=1 Tax=Lepeophtheirus salmonis TaxID=72036 RepID=A0A0K2U9E7_LEPSM